MIRVLAIIVDYAGVEDAARLGVSLAGANAVPGLSVVHLDNGNVIPVILTDKERAAGVRLLRAPKNAGYAAGLNFAIRELGADFDAYWFLNPDLEVEPDCLPKLIQIFDTHAEVGAAGPRVMYGATARVWGARGVISPWLGVTAMTDWPDAGRLPRWSYLPGCSLLVRAEAYRRVGGLPERYRLYFEETELCVRLQKAGFELWVEPGAVARHLVRSREDGVPARHFAFYFARNNLYFWRENFGIPWPLQLPRMAFVVAKELLFPLRHARSLGEAYDRLRYVLSGFGDSRAFLREAVTPRERRLFPETK